MLFIFQHGINVRVIYILLNGNQPLLYNSHGFFWMYLFVNTRINKMWPNGISIPCENLLIDLTKILTKVVNGRYIHIYTYTEYCEIKYLSGERHGTFVRQFALIIIWRRLINSISSYLYIYWYHHNYSHKHINIYI